MVKIPVESPERWIGRAAADFVITDLRHHCLRKTVGGIGLSAQLQFRNADGGSV